MPNLYGHLSAEQLRAKSGKTMVARAAAGHRKYFSSPGFA